MRFGATVLNKEAFYDYRFVAPSQVQKSVCSTINRLSQISKINLDLQFGLARALGCALNIASCNM